MAISVGVLGGTGAAGGAAVRALRRRGIEVRVLARRGEGRGRVDVGREDGLEAAFAGIDVLVETLNGPPRRASAAAAVLVDGVDRALRVARAAGVGHVVSLSVLGAERVPFGYYRVKVDQEQVVRGAALPWTIVRATQFHGLVAAAFAASARVGALLAPRGVLQPVDVDAVGEALAEAVERREPEAIQEVAGPQIASVASLAKAYRAQRGLRRPIVALPPVGRALRAVASGALTDASAPRQGIGFEQWLTENA